MLGLRICSMASNAQGVVVRAHIRALTSSRRAQQTTEHYVSYTSTHRACSITAARGDLSNVCEATGWKTLGQLLFLGEVIFHIAVFYFSRKYYVILVAATIPGDKKTLLASQTKGKTLLEVLCPQPELLLELEAMGSGSLILVNHILLPKKPASPWKAHAASSMGLEEASGLESS